MSEAARETVQETDQRSAEAPRVESDPARIGSLIAGRAAPRSKIVRALGTLLASLTRASGPIGELMGEVMLVPRGVADAPEEGGRWARLSAPPAGEDGKAEPDAVLVHVSDALAAEAGTRMLGGTGGTGGTNGTNGTNGTVAPTPIDWRLAELVLQAIGEALPEPVSFRDWTEDVPAPDGVCGGLGIAFVSGEKKALASSKPLETPHALRVAFPASLLGRIAGAERETSAPETRDDRGSKPKRAEDPRRSASVGLRATLDLGACELNRIVALAPGDVLPLGGRLDAVAIRADAGPVLFEGALGHSAGHLCLRIGRRAPETEFRHFRPPTVREAPAAAPESSAQAAVPTEEPQARSTA